MARTPICEDAGSRKETDFKASRHCASSFASLCKTASLSDCLRCSEMLTKASATTPIIAIHAAKAVVLSCERLMRTSSLELLASATFLSVSASLDRNYRSRRTRSEEHTSELQSRFE